MNQRRKPLKPLPNGPSHAGRRKPGVLTSRERRVVQLISEGCTSKEAAQRLQISVKTVDTHRSNIMRKLGLHAVSQLVRYAIRNQLIEP